MRFRNYLFFVRSNLTSRPRRTWVATGSVAVAVGLFFCLTSLGFGLRKEILKKVETIFPERIILATPAPALIGESWIPTKTLEAIRSNPGIEHVSPRMTVTCPIRAWSDMTGDFMTDVIAYGVDRRLVEQDLPPETPFEWSPENTGPVPVLISRYFLDLLGAGLAKDSVFGPFANLLAAGLIGKQFTVEFGASVLDTSKKGFLITDAVLLGYSQNPSLIGLVVPESFAVEMNRRYREGKSAIGTKDETGCRQIHVFLRDLKDYDSVAAFLTKEMGLKIEGNRDRVQKVRWMTAGAAGGLLVVGFLVLLLASVNVSNTFALLVMERRGEIGLFRAIGMTQSDVKWLLILQSGFMGFLGAIAGSLAGLFLAWLGNMAAERFLPDLFIVPRSIFSLSAGLSAFSVLVTIFFGLLATYPIAKDYSSRWPDELLKR